MYLQRFSIANIKNLEHVDIEFPHVGDDYSGWVVILGGNGMGKSTLLQAMAIGLVGPVAGQRLLLNPDGWVRQGAEHGDFRTWIVGGERDKAPGGRKRAYDSIFVVTGREEIEIGKGFYVEPQLVLVIDAGHDSLNRGPYSSRNPGWFSCGYGPFRRLRNASVEGSRRLDPSGREARFATLFSEGAALTQSADWLPGLYSRSIDSRHPGRERAGAALEVVQKVIEGLLPGKVGVLVDSERVRFRRGDGPEVPILDLSDGYRSFLALVIDILRHLEASSDDFAALVEYEGDEPRIVAEGVVLIDEVDAHLHPYWQREIGARLRRAFPRMQFIVTSHSPFIAQAASDDGLIVLKQAAEGGAVEAQKPEVSVKGWRVDQILTSPLFGLDATRDEETEALIREHAGLVAKRAGGKLSRSDRASLERLEGRLSERLTAPGETAEERARQVEMERYVEETLKKLGKRP